MSPVAPDPAVVAGDVARALAEDVGSGDVTAALLPDTTDDAYLLCKEPAVVCGRPWFDACVRALDPDARIDWRVAEGDHVTAGTVLANLRGRARALVTAERTALNFMQTLSATATTTAAHVAAVAGTGTRILDTRKTIPGLRHAQKYAVRTGGGTNHRMGLHDTVMLKENHVRAAGSIARAVAAARASQARSRPPGFARNPRQVLLPAARSSPPRRSAGGPAAMRAAPPGTAGSRWRCRVAWAWTACVRSRTTAWTTSRSARSPSTCVRSTCR